MLSFPMRRCHFAFVSLSALLAAFFIALPSSADPQASSAEARSADTVAEALFERYNVPALSVAVLRDGEPVYQRVLGSADLEHGVAAEEETLFRLGSLSKLVTVAALARLVDAGKIDLDAPISRYTDAFPNGGDGVTARRLASHTAGVRHYLPKDFAAVGEHFFAHRSGHESLREGLVYFVGDPLVAEPGTTYNYSSYGYNLLGVVLEGASGEDFLTTVSQTVLDPLGIAGIVPDWRHEVIPGRTAFYYANPETGEVVHDQPVDNSYKWPSGGYLASAGAFARLAAQFLEPGFFSAGILETVFTAQPNAESNGMRVGLGWRIEQDDAGRTVYHHGGAIAGGRAFVLAYAEEKLVVVLLANTYARFGRPEAEELAAPFLAGEEE